MTERRDSHRTFKLAVQPLVSPAESLAADELLRRDVVLARDGGVMRVYGFAGDLLSLGRYHAVPAELAPGRAQSLYRRHSGGRNLPSGDGFVGLSIVLPHRSALVSEEPLALAPHQVLNRSVRGILEGLKSIGIPAFYPGRDWITVDRRVIGMVSFDVAADGGMVFEALLALSRDFTLQHGAWNEVRAAPLAAADVTSVKVQLGVDLTVADVAEVLARGYAQQFGLSFETIDLETGPLRAETTELARSLFEPQAWLSTRTVSPGLEHHASIDVMLGVFEAFACADASGLVRDVLLSGDIIANSPAITDLERRMRGCRADRASIDTVVTETLRVPENFILGIPNPEAITSTILRALSSE